MGKLRLKHILILQVAGFLLIAGILAYAINITRHVPLPWKRPPLSDIEKQAAAAVKKEEKAGQKAFQEIGTEEALRLHREKKALFVDARFHKDFIAKRIAGAINLPPDMDEDTKASLLEKHRKEKVIVTYCSSASCSLARELAHVLLLLDYTDIVEFPGGLRAWSEVDGPIEEREGTGKKQKILRQIGYEEALALHREKKALFLDARANKDFMANHIAGAINLPPDMDESTKVSLLEKHRKEKILVTYCRSATCPLSRNLSQALLGLGYTEILEFSGGMEVWDRENGPMEKAPALTDVPPAPAPLNEEKGAGDNVHSTPNRAVPPPAQNRTSSAGQTKINITAWGIDVKTAMKLYEDKQAVFIDARPAHEFAPQHITGAFNLPPNFFLEEQKALFEKNPKGKTVVLYGGAKSYHLLTQLARILDFQGYTNIRLLAGGIESWMANKGSVASVPLALEKKKYSTKTTDGTPSPHMQKSIELMMKNFNMDNAQVRQEQK